MRNKEVVDRGNREFLDVFLVLGAFFTSIAVTLILNEEIISLGGWPFVLKAFFGICLVGIAFRKIVEKPGLVDEFDETDVANGTVIHKKCHYRHPVFYYIVEVMNLLIAPALVGFFMAGMFIHLGS